MQSPKDARKKLHTPPKITCACPFKHLQMSCEPSKILTRHRVTSRTDFGRFFSVLPSLVVIFQIRNALTSAEFFGFRGKNLKKQGKKFTKSRIGEAKTSDFFDTNIRTFDAKHPYFVPKKSDVSCFPAENGAKMPFL